MRATYLKGSTDWKVPQVTESIPQLSCHRAAVLLQDLCLDGVWAILKAAKLGDKHLDIEGMEEDSLSVARLIEVEGLLPLPLL